MREERDLYRYAMAHNGLGDGGDFVGSVEASIAGAVGMLLSARQDEPADDAETVAFGIVGMVQLATNRWLDRPGQRGVPRDHPDRSRVGRPCAADERCACLT